MKLLITGGNGFVGKHLKNAFKGTDHVIWYPTSKELDLTKSNSINTICEYGPDAIIHMAAKCGGILANKNSPADFLRDNTQMALNIYEGARMANVKLVYSLGSVCSYPKYCPVPFNENDIWNGYPEETNAPYGIAKRVLLMLGQTYREQYGIGGAHLIPVNMFGEFDNFDLTTSHVIPAFIHKFDEAIKNGTNVECWGSGNATREFLYAGDTAQAIVKAVSLNFDSPLPINLGTGQDISIKKLAYLIGLLMDFKGEIIFKNEGLDGQPKRMLDVSRAKELLDWEAKVSLRIGLLKTIEWYRLNLKRDAS
jgi:GDP-L-fucose synthase